MMMMVTPSEGMRFLVETPETHQSAESQAFIRQEIERPSKVWVQEVVRSDRESEFVKLRTEEFVLLPDLNGHRRQARAFKARAQQQQQGGWRGQQPVCGGGDVWGRGWRAEEKGQRWAWDKQVGGWSADKHVTGWGADKQLTGWGADNKDIKQQQVVEWRAENYGIVQRWTDKRHEKGGERWAVEKPADALTTAEGKPYALKCGGGAVVRHRFNWLAIVADPSLRSVRDLRGEHIGMLERLYEQCVVAIQREYAGVSAGDIMVFANYPPSVYKLHFHFCAPFFQPTAYDAFRMHSLSGIINNLRIHPLYYKLSSLQIPVHSGSELYRAMGGEKYVKQDEGKEEEEEKSIVQ